MSRRRWIPLAFAALAGAATWLAWRFLPRDGWTDWRSRWRGAAPAARHLARTLPFPRRPTASPAPAPPTRSAAAAAPPDAEPAPGSLAAAVLDPVTAEPLGDAPPPGATQADDPARCAASTHSGTRCTRPAEPGSPYCWQHAPG